MPSIGIADKVTLDAIKTLLGLNTDAAGTSTVFARLAQIAGYTDQVEGYVDTLESSLNAGVTWGRTFTPGTTTLTSSSLQTVLNLSGKGTLKYIIFSLPTSLTVAQLKLTMDGVVRINSANVMSDTPPYKCAVTPQILTGLSQYMESLYYYPFALIDLDFKTSLKIEVASDGTRSLPVYWGYNI